jgi:hypothetical protein
VLAIQKKVGMETFMKTAQTVLSDAGFSKDAVKVKIEDKKRGVVRDILDEPNKNYDILLLGKPGVSKIQDLFIDSVVNKLISRSDRIPIVVVSKKPDPKKCHLEEHYPQVR